uniref:NADH-ubiquinone oxidoreductase chain 1 n=1 Tax=Pholoe pallida TaxID=328599 RepID=A0A343W6L4_9ANNE|nr:NADH dehydrogenase subunit 1 [Pholoe pallida]
MLFSSFLSLLISLIAGLIAMAFFTLLERKVIGYAQIRKGPNKVGLVGIPQPLADALKLFTKEQTSPSFSNKPVFLLAPTGGLTLALLLWFLYPFSFPSFFLTLSVLIFLAVSSLNVYVTLIAGWASNSKYALLGALRSVAQTISYEISMSLILLGVLILINSFNLASMTLNNYFWLIMVLMPSFFMWFITTLAETNRTPFDFAEGESELVSGFNTEYSGGPFALIFMAEYMNILMISLLSVVFFSGSVPLSMFTGMSLATKTIFIAFSFLWIRASLPRMRYDRLMALTWKSFLPITLTTLIMTPTMMFL